MSGKSQLPNGYWTRFKKEKRASPRTEFKHGMIPWNKGKSKLNDMSIIEKRAYHTALQNKNPVRRWCRTTLYNHKYWGYVVKVTISELYQIALSTKNCGLCGIELDWKKKNERGPKINSPSLDRVSNGVDLTKENIEIICFPCNMGKGKMSRSGYIDHCRRVVVMSENV